MHRKRLWNLGLIITLAACARPWTEKNIITPVSPWASGQIPSAVVVASTPTISYNLPTPRPPEAPILTPTADAPHYQANIERGPKNYIVQPGDMLSAIAERYSVSMEALAQANNITNPDALEVGQTLTIPAVTAQAPGPNFKQIPDSELVYGPLSATFDAAAFIRSKGGTLASFSQDVNGETLDGAQVVERIALDYSVSPRLLLAMLEYRTGMVTNPSAKASVGETPFGYIDDWYKGLYRQLAWASVQLNSGFYRWQANSVTDWVLEDGSVVPIAPTINAGTAGVQNFFARLDDYDTWLRDVSPGGFQETYLKLFGYPFDTAIEPLVPANLFLPLLHLPFLAGETWFFTGGPHLSWDAGSPYGALDFGPPDANGCNLSNAWVTAVADGLITRTGPGTVIQDLDLDGNEGTGWVILYYHIESRERAQAGTTLRAGDRIGHASCEGGIYTGAHVHLARKFNGVWLPVVGARANFVMDGWTPEGTGEEYVGSLRRNGKTVVNLDGMSEANQIQR
jgi:LasA protease